MAGYTRQSVADIIANAVIKAAPVNAEYNAIRDAFAQATGHKHDGTTAEGAYVPLISDPDAYNKIVIDTANNRISFYNEVSTTAVEQIRLEDGVLKPVTDNDIDLGASGLEFKDLYIDGTGYIDTVNVHENATITGNLTVSGTTTLGNTSISGTTTLSSVDINGGAIDGTVIGASSAAAGSFTTVTTSGQATLATADINGGTADNVVIGGTTAAAITGTTVTANTGFTGDLTGDVTGNVTGNLTGNVTGNITGDVTGNVTAASGSSTFNNMTINGTLDVTSTVINNVSDPVSAQQAATKNYVDTEIASLVDSAPGTLDTLNELAAALGDDPNFSTTITNSIATKLPLAGGTMTGAIAMSTNKITGMGDPTAAQDAATKTYVDTQRDTRLALSGGTMTGAIDMGSSKITTTYTPTNNADLTTKTYVDGILGSATAAATSAAAAATSATNAATSATAAATSATNAAASYDSFDDRYLGAKASAPTLDNDGDALITGALYFNSTDNNLYVYTGTTWVTNTNYGVAFTNYTATGGQTSFAVNYSVGYVNVYLNGVKLLLGTDFTATNGTTVVLTTGATAGDIVDIVAYNIFTIADTYTQAQADAKFAQVANNLSDLASASTARTNLGVAIGSDVQAYDAQLADIAGLTPTDSNFIVGNGSNFVLESGATARTSLGLSIGSDVQAYSSNLASINQDLATTDSVTFNNVVTGTTDHGTVSSTFNIAASDGQIQKITLGASITVSSSSLNDGDSLIFMVDDGSAYAVTWSSFIWSNNDGVAPTLVTSGYNVFSVWKIGASAYIAYAGDQ